jgi:hypothetical protein
VHYTANGDDLWLFQDTVIEVYKKRTSWAAAPTARPTPAAPDVGPRRLRSPSLTVIASHGEHEDAVLSFALAPLEIAFTL